MYIYIIKSQLVKMCCYIIKIIFRTNRYNFCCSQLPNLAISFSTITVNRNYHINKTITMTDEYLIPNQIHNLRDHT